MSSARRAGFWLSILVLSISTACGPKRIQLPVRSGQSLTVILPDSDTGQTGDARVANPHGGVDLTDALNNLKSFGHSCV